MSTHDVRFHRFARPLTVAALCLAGILACEDDQAPTPQPAGIEIVSGDAQYTRTATTLEEPVAVRVTLEDGVPAANVEVRFQVIEGGGTLSRTLATTNNEGRTSVRWTVGPDTGLNRLRISVDGNSNLTTVATATAAEYYCVEEDPTFVQKFTPVNGLVMLTRQSSHSPGAAGLIRYTVDSNNLNFGGQLLSSYPEGAFPYVIRDCTFSANGDLYFSWNHIHDEVVKVAANGTVSHFATLESPFGTELAMTPNGVLIGCDDFGPFYVTCRDSVFRFEGAVFSGDLPSRDAANNDAVACDPTSGDVYFIYKADRDLMKVPFDGVTSGTPVKVADLTQDESDFARGMVVDGTDGSIYLTVESANTKSLVNITPAGTVTTAYDFHDRGAGDAAGEQSDLAIDRAPVRRFLYTLDTLNNVFLLYRISTDELFELTPEGDAFSASDASSGERVGLDVILGP